MIYFVIMLRDKNEYNLLNYKFNYFEICFKIIKSFYLTKIFHHSFNFVFNNLIIDITFNNKYSTIKYNFDVKRRRK